MNTLLLVRFVYCSLVRGGEKRSHFRRTSAEPVSQTGELPKRRSAAGPPPMAAAFTAMGQDAVHTLPQTL
jgi:hypothetical protein